MLSTVILSIVTFLQNLKFEYIYTGVAIYVGMLWIFYAVWLWHDTKKRFSSETLRTSVWFLTTITFFLGLILYLVARPAKKDDDDSWVSLERSYLVYETYGMGDCTCGEHLRPEFLNCPTCGHQLREKCSNCEQIVDVSWKRCPFCNTVRIEELEEEQVFSKPSFPIYMWKNLLLGISAARSWMMKDARISLKKAKKIEKNMRKQYINMKKKTVSKTQKSTKKTISNKSPIVSTVKKLLFVEEKVTSKKNV